METSPLSCEVVLPEKICLTSPELTDNSQRGNSLFTTRRRQDWCRWPLCQTYRMTARCPFYSRDSEHKHGTVLCEAAHIGPTEVINLTADGDVRVCFDSMGLVRSHCRRSNCAFYHPPKPIRDKIVAQRHAQYLQERQNRQSQVRPAKEPLNCLQRRLPEGSFSLESTLSTSAAGVHPGFVYSGGSQMPSLTAAMQPFCNTKLPHILPSLSASTVVGVPNALAPNSVLGGGLPIYSPTGCQDNAFYYQMLYQMLAYNKLMPTLPVLNAPAANMFLGLPTSCWPQSLASVSSTVYYLLFF